MGKSITLDFDKFVEFCVEFCNDRIEHFDFLAVLLFAGIVKERGYRAISDPAVKNALMSLYGQDTSKLWARFPLTREEYNTIEEWLKDKLGKITLVTSGVDYEVSLKKFLESGVEELSKIDPQDPECYLQMVQTCHILRDAYGFLRDFDPSSKKYKVSNILDFLRKVEQLSLIVTAKAYEVVGYQKAKMRRFDATQPASEAKKRGMMGRVEKLVEELKEHGEKTENGIEISRDILGAIFEKKTIGIEVYSDKTKKKYKKMAEKILGQKILYKK